MTTLREKMKNEMQLRGFAAGTQKAYLKKIIELYEYYKRSPAKLSQEEIKAYLLYLVYKRKLSANTYNVVIHALKFFYEVVLRRTIVHHDFPLSKQAKKLPDILSTDEVTAIIKAALHIKQKTILVLAYGAGLRSAEIVHLKLGDIDNKRMLLHIRNSKGNKDRYVVLSPFVLSMLRLYWHQYRSKIQCKEKWLFPGIKPHKPIAIRTIGYIFKQAVKRTDITKNGGIHSLRHAFATHALEAGEDLHTIKQLLGHARITTTARYLHMTSNKMKSIVPPIEALNL